MRQAAVTIELSSAPSQLQLVGLGIVFAFAFAWFGARRDEVPYSEAFALLGLGAIAAAAGGRLWSLATWFFESPETFEWVIAPLEPAGYASAGALVGAAAMALVAFRIFGREFLGIADVIAPAGFIALGMARLGCVVEGCDVGRPSELFGVVYPDGSQLHPFGAYIAIPVVSFAVLSYFRGFHPGGRAAAVVFVYGLVRFGAEFMRQAPTLFHEGHIIALAALGTGAIGWVISARGGHS